MYPWKSQLKLTVAMEFSMEITVSMEIIGVNHHDGISTMGTWCIHGNHFENLLYPWKSLWKLFIVMCITMMKYHGCFYCIKEVYESDKSLDILG